jgi:hypothetical protein
VRERVAQSVGGDGGHGGGKLVPEGTSRNRAHAAVFSSSRGVIRALVSILRCDGATAR